MKNSPQKRTYPSGHLCGRRNSVRKPKTGGRFLRLLQDAKTGAFDLVAVKDISRFCPQHGGPAAKHTGPSRLWESTRFFLTSSQTVLGNSEFVLTVFGALAQEESANTSKRVKFGKRLNAEKGRVPNLVYGYDKKNGEYFDLAVNPAEAAVVRRNFFLCTPRKDTAREGLRLCSTPREPAPSGAAPSAKRPCPGF